MNINDLTLKQILEIKNIFNNVDNINKKDEFVGKYVICRCYAAGVHAGELISQNGDIVELKKSRRLWKWGNKNGVALSGVAQFGLGDDCKVDTVNPLIRLTGVIETIVASEISRESINGY